MNIELEKALEAQVNGYVGRGVLSARVDTDGHLILTMTDGEKVDVGVVALQVDKTLTKSGQAADAKETGARISGVQQTANEACQVADDAKAIAHTAQEKAESAKIAADYAAQRADDAYQLAMEAEGVVGPEGKSAYDIAKANGFEGTEAQWLESLRGAPGATGPKGDPGEKGEKGDKGDKGDTGPAGKDGANGKDGNDGSNGKDGVSLTHSWNGTTLTVTSANGTSSADLKGSKGDKGDAGSAGTSVTVKSVSESTADGGSNVVTFSDGKTVTIKNGSKGSTGDKGADGKTPVRGTDYWTESDKIEILNDVSASMTYAEPQKVAFTTSKSCVSNPSGKIEGSSDHYRTDYIELSGYDTIEFYGKCANSKYSLAFFDSGKTIMSDVSVVGAGTALTTHTMQIPNGAAYAVGSAYVGSSVDATEEKYYVLVSSSSSNPVAEAITKMKKALYSFDGKKVMFFGDSITYDESMYVANLLKSTGMVRIANFAVNGATLNNYSDTQMNGSPAQDGTHNNTVPNQVQKLLNNVSGYETPDIVIVSAGTNGGATEAAYEESQYANEDGSYIELEAVSLTKFSGAIRWIYEKLISCYPDAKVFFATPIQSYGGGSRTFAILSAKAECIRQNCERLSTPCIDAFRKSGIYGRYEASSTNGKYLKDGLHPNSAGAVVLAKCYHRELANALID